MSTLHGAPTRTIPRLLAAAVAALALAACSSDDGASVRDLGSDASSGSDASASGSSSSSGSSSAPASGSGSASAPADEPAECEPVAPEREADADATLEITVEDFAFDREEYEVEAGLVTFVVTNAGDVNHEVAVLPGGGDVPYTDGAPDEAALEEAGAFELEAFGPGLTCNATFELEPGTYTLFCIVEIGEDHNHYDEGMRATLVVT